MRCANLFLIAALLLGAPGVVQAAEGPALVTSDRSGVLEISEGLQVIARQSERFWPGFRLSEIPLVFHQPGGAAFLLQHPAPFPPGFVPMAGHPTIGVMPIARGFPRGVDTEFNLGTREAVVVSVEPGMSWHQALITGIHEAFHHHQHAHRFALRGSSTDVSVHSARDLALAEAEQAMLADALAASTTPRGQELARMFLAVRETRQQTLSDAMADAEDTLESLEGTANYVEQRVRIAVAEAPMPLVFARSRSGVLTDLALDLRHPLTERTFGRTRYYMTGAAMGFLLDRWLKAWPQQAEQNQTPAELLRRATKYTSASRAGLMKKVEARFNLAAAMRRHQVSLERAKQRQLSALAAFENQAGKRVDVEIAFAYGGISVSTQGLTFGMPGEKEFNEQAIVSLESGSGTSVLLQGTIISGHTLEGEVGYYAYQLVLPVRPEELLLNGRPLPTASGRYVGAVQWKGEGIELVSPRATVEVTPTRLRIRV